MMSARYASAVVLLLALALVPTIIHSYARVPVADGLTTATITNEVGGYAGREGERDATWGRRRFESDDWFSRVYTRDGHALTLTVVRSLDAKQLYHHPELAVAYGNDFARADSRRMRRRPDVPVHVLEPGPGGRARALYALHYDGGFVDEPLRFQLSNAFELLISRRQPMTLFFVLDEAPEPEGDLDSWRAGNLLSAAIDDFVRAR